MHITTLVAKLARESYARGGTSSDLHRYRFPAKGPAAEFASLFEDAVLDGCTVTIPYDEGGACVYALAA